MREIVAAVGLIKLCSGMYVADEFDKGEKHIAYDRSVEKLKQTLIAVYRIRTSPKRMEMTFTRQSDGIKYVVYVKGKRK